MELLGLERYLCLVIICFLSIDSTVSVRILAVNVFASYSHNIVYQPIWRELSKRGHKIVSISTDPIRDESLTNLTEIDISNIGNTEWKELNKMLLVTNKKPSAATQAANYYKSMENIFDKMFQLKQVQALVTEKFDLVITEWSQPFVFGFSARYKCPLITLTSSEPINYLYEALGNPVNILIYSEVGIRKYSSAENLHIRALNLLYYFWTKIFFNNNVYPNSDRLIAKHIGDDIPPVTELIKTVSMNFINTNFIINVPKPLLPTFKTFSFIHIKPTQQLPQDIQQFLDSAKKGAVYFSLGSNIKSDMLPTSLHLLLMETFRELPYKILWKDNNPDIKNLPGNVFVSKWFPQNDILAHENVKVFVTQGGMQSVEEALMRKKPMVGIPLLVDQHKNIFKLEKHQIAVYVELSTITKEILKEAIITVAENQTYKKNIEKISDLLQDEPMKSLDMIVWWIEYVIRHNGTEHFRSPYFTTTWVEQMGVDIFAIMFLFIICLVIVLRGIFKFIVRCFGKIFSKSDKKKTQ